MLVVNTKVTLKGKNEKVNKSNKASSVANTLSIGNKAKITSDQKKGDPRAVGALISNKSRSHTPLFLLTFEILN